jgi:hypothetical protein
VKYHCHVSLVIKCVIGDLLVTNSIKSGRRRGHKEVSKSSANEGKREDKFSAVCSVQCDLKNTDA